ncbi:MAG: methionine adenosyltransferase [Richelia sp. SM1_7_0]|nr:methionine adenosyltransferase [Richelia sp. SM1_7_0]
MKKDFMFTSESVTQGHPDKLCDRISDAIVDRMLQQDPYSRIITECAVSTGIVFLSARFEPNTNVDFTNVARRVIKDVGYDQPSFNSKTCSILTSLEELPASKEGKFDEKQLTDAQIEQIGVKNQVTVFGFACNQTQTLIPLPIWLAHKLARQLDKVRQEEILPYLAPDGKTQVGVEYRDTQSVMPSAYRCPYRIHSITIIASQKDLSYPDLKQLEKEIYETVIKPAFTEESIQPDNDTHIFINPDGIDSPGGPASHAGLTGRKNAIDTYGEYAKHSGAALSGKDPIRIDKVAAYAARYAAINIIAANIADECEVQLSYTIGQARPVSIEVETFGTGKIAEDEIIEQLQQHFDFRLAGIIRQFNLRLLPSLNQGKFYQQLASYGHMGRMDLELPWEKTDKVSIF